MPEWSSVPNLLSLLRLLLAPLVFWAILQQRHSLALEIFAAAALTDALDGMLARRFGKITRLGAYLDPIADKFLLSGVYLSLAAVGSVPWWLVAVIFARDLFLLASSGLALVFTNLRQFPPSLWGKASTLLQVLTAIAGMARNAGESPALDRLAAALIWPTAAVTVWSGIHYSWRGWRLLRMH